MNRSSAEPGRTRLRSTLALVALAGMAIVSLAPSASATTAGEARVITRDGSAPAHGGSATPFVVILPGGAKCPGDTAHKWYLVNSFLVPQGVSPTAVNFRGGVPSRGFGLIAHGAYVGALNTARDTGAVVNLPNPSAWSRLTTHDIFTGTATSSTWTGGIACATSEGVVTNYWSFPVHFVRSVADPGGFTWSIPASSKSPGSGESSSSWTSALLVAAAVALIGGWFATRRVHGARSAR